MRSLILLTLIGLSFMATPSTTGAVVSILVPQDNEGAIQIHPKHPQAGLKSHYATRAEWPRPSSQVHWSPSENPIEHLLLHLRKISHAHMECALPIYGITARATLRFGCQVQAFHMPGRVEVFSTGLYFPDIVIEWDRPEPMIGDPNGVVVRQINVTLSANTMPLKGIWRVAMTARAQLDNGTRYDATQEIPLCVACDGSENEGDFILTTHVSGFFNVSPLPGSRGGPTVDLFGFLPIIGVPLERRYEVPVRSFAYQQDQAFPGGGAFEQTHRPNIHFGDPGILWRRIAVPPPAVNGVNDIAIFDPAVLGPGKSKVSLGWKDDTEGGNDRFAPGEQFMAFVVVEVEAPGTTTPPTEPPPSACAGVYEWRFTDIGDVREFRRVFVVAPGSPANCVRPLVPIGG
jgi:hypothetical protein